MLALAAVAASSGGRGVRAQTGAAPGAAAGGLRFRLSESRPAVAPARASRGGSVPLSSADAARILARVPPIAAEPTDVQALLPTATTAPPPRAGRTIVVPFAPRAASRPPSTAAPGPLRVLRIAPEGDVPVASGVAITFSQPMVPIGSVGSAAAVVPARLEPHVAGQWRWLGTQTLVFDPGSGRRLPMATTYRVTVPAGTRSVTGGVLQAALAWTFRTPAVRLVDHLPASASVTPGYPLIWLAFDQRVDASAVLRTARLTTGASACRLRLATPTEMARDAAIIRSHGAGTPAERTVALEPLRALPPATAFRFTMDAGTPSREGERRTAAAQGFGFATAGPLRLIGAVESNRQYDALLTLRFSNPLDRSAFDGSSVTVVPHLDGLFTRVDDNKLYVYGNATANTTYRITVPRTLRDSVGQILGSAIVHRMVGEASPAQVLGPRGLLTVGDPTMPPEITFVTENTPAVRLSFYSVTPSDWRAWIAYGRAEFVERPDGNRPGPGRLVEVTTVPIRPAPEQWVESTIPLGPILAAGSGDVVVLWQSMAPGPNPDRGATWYEATRLGLAAEYDMGSLYAWVTDLATGKPIPGATVAFAGSGVSASGTDTAVTAESDGDGVARLPLPTTPQDLLVATHGSDVALLTPLFIAMEDSRWRRYTDVGDSRWYMFQDRTLYRPGDTVHVKGWLRHREPGTTGDLRVATESTPISWHLDDSQGHPMQNGACRSDSAGGFDLAIPLPATMASGVAYLSVSDANGETGQRIAVQEFRRPEFQVTTHSLSAGPAVAGDPAGADVEAATAYYSGGSLAAASVLWTVSTSPTDYTPPGRDDFTFGDPWRLFDDHSDGRAVQSLRARIGADGKHRLHLQFDAAAPAVPYRVQIAAAVQDINRQAHESGMSLIVHPSTRYVGLRSEQTNPGSGGKVVEIRGIVCGIDGLADPGREVRLHAAHIDETIVGSTPRYRETNVQEWTVSSGGDGKIDIRFRPSSSGEWRIRATVRDDSGRSSTTMLVLSVPDPRESEAGPDAQPQTVQLVPDKERYRPGDTANVAFEAPFDDADALVTVAHNGIVSVSRVSITGRQCTLHIPILDSYVPEVDVTVELAGAKPRSDGSPLLRPTGCAGQIVLAVPAESRRLSVSVTPRDLVLRPGASTSVAVLVSDASGRPIADADVALAVVDESVLDLSGNRKLDPIDAFYPYAWTSVDACRTRSSLPTLDPQIVSQWSPALDHGGLAGADTISRVLASSGPHPPNWLIHMTDFPAQIYDLLASRGGAEEDPASIALRANFDALAAFVPSVRTGADGTVQVPVTLPGNLTRYRVFAVAVSGAQQIGEGEASITAQLPLMARPSAPRFLNVGDRFQLPIVLQNETDQDATVDVAVRGVNLILPGDTARRATVPAHDRVEMQFPAAADRPGTGRLQVVAVTPDNADAAEISVPVHTPASAEAFATYGVIDGSGGSGDHDAVAQAVQAPAGALPGYGGLDITTASTEMPELGDVAAYLTAYPYDCAEQVSSRLLALTALRDVPGALKAADLGTPAEQSAAAARDLSRLGDLQQADGGFGFWTRDSKPYPYLGVHAAHAVVAAKRAGLAVPDDLYGRCLAYVRAIGTKFGPDYTARMRRMVTAYALYVRHLAGEDVREQARQLLDTDTPDGLGPETVGWLTTVLAGDPALAPARLWLRNHVTETTGSAHYAFTYRDDDYLVLDSDRRSDAIVLDALLADQPDSDLIPKLVRGLLDSRKDGVWSSTQEDAFALVALAGYFHAHENNEPNFTAGVWLGETQVADARFQGYTTDRFETHIPMAALPQTAENLTVGKQGSGALYYRIGLRYAPANVALAPSDQGFAVSRIFEAVDAPADVRREADGAWLVRAGARVRVRVRMIATDRRYHVALTCPLPAGFETVNPDLRGSESVPPAGEGSGTEGATGVWDAWKRWWDYDALRDDRAEAFTALLPAGEYEYTFVCRATTPGAFVVPPVRAEEMYAPETFGRSGTDRVEIR
jgi:hypothetical protein